MNLVLLFFVVIVFHNFVIIQYNFYLNSLATQNGFTSVSDFQNQYAAISFSNSISIELYNFIQSRFTSNFAVNFGQYTANFYSDSNNEILIYNTTNRYGWNTSLSPSVSETSIDSNELACGFFCYKLLGQPCLATKLKVF